MVKSPKIKILNIISGSKYGGAELFFERLALSFERCYKIEQKIIIRNNRIRSKEFIDGLNGIEKILVKEKPTELIVQGDTNTALAGCLGTSIFNRKFLAEKKKVKIIHIESGLRSFDNKMPEEINRKLIDQLSDILFVPTSIDLINLKKENLVRGKKFIIYDMRNIYSPMKIKNQGFKYYSIGR